MFRGNHPATVDDKGRLKIPAAFLARLRQDHGDRVFVTSFNGESARIYPLPLWEEIEASLGGSRGAFDPTIARFRFQVGYYGGEATLDPQGRVVLPRRLRQAADLSGMVDVIGQSAYLEAVSAGRAEEWASRRLSDEELTFLSQAGAPL